MTQCEAIIEAFENLGGERSIKDIADYINSRYKDYWKDFGTPMADMVPLTHGGNNSSLVPNWCRVLERVPGKRGIYRLIRYQD